MSSLISSAHMITTQLDESGMTYLHFSRSIQGLQGLESAVNKRYLWSIGENLSLGQATASICRLEGQGLFASIRLIALRTLNTIAHHQRLSEPALLDYALTVLGLSHGKVISIGSEAGILSDVYIDTDQNITVVITEDKVFRCRTPLDNIWLPSLTSITNATKEALGLDLCHNSREPLLLLDGPQNMPLVHIVSQPFLELVRDIPNLPWVDHSTLSLAGALRATALISSTDPEVSDCTVMIRQNTTLYLQQVEAQRPLGFTYHAPMLVQLIFSSLIGSSLWIGNCVQKVEDVIEKDCLLLLILEGDETLVLNDSQHFERIRIPDHAEPGPFISQVIEIQSSLNYLLHDKDQHILLKEELGDLHIELVSSLAVWLISGFLSAQGLIYQGKQHPRLLVEHFWLWAISLQSKFDYAYRLLSDTLLATNHTKTTAKCPIFWNSIHPHASKVSARVRQQKYPNYTFDYQCKAELFEVLDWDIEQGRCSLFHDTLGEITIEYEHRQLLDRRLITTSVEQHVAITDHKMHGGHDCYQYPTIDYIGGEPVITVYSQATLQALGVSDDDTDRIDGLGAIVYQINPKCMTFPLRRLVRKVYWQLELQSHANIQVLEDYRIIKQHAVDQLADFERRPEAWVRKHKWLALCMFLSNLISWPVWMDGFDTIYDVYEEDTENGSQLTIRLASDDSTEFLICEGADYEMEMSFLENPYPRLSRLLGFDQGLNISIHV